MTDFKLLLLLIIIFGGILTVNGHGADVTDDVMVIADESTGIPTKEVIVDLNLDIKVYKFTSEQDVTHQLEHALTNPNKRILIVAFQDTTNEFLSKHPELHNKVIICNNTDKKSIEDGVIQFNSILNEKNDVKSFNINYINLILAIVLIGLVSSIGIFFLKNRK